jgi:hypothetical protein
MSRNRTQLGVIGRKPPDGSVIAQGEEPARGCADLDDRSHGSTATSGYFPSAFRTSVAITHTFGPHSSGMCAISLVLP